MGHVAIAKNLMPNPRN